MDRLYWSRRFSLTTRILALNIIALALMAGSLFYLDSLRKQLIAERFKLARSEVEIMSDALSEAREAQRRPLLARIAREQKLRLRLYDAHGRLVADSFAISEPAFAFVDPAREPWYQHAARGLDRTVDWLVTAPRIEDYREPARDDATHWPEIAAARMAAASVVRLRYAPDRTPVINAAAPVGIRGETLLSTRNARDVTQAIRDARQTLAIVVAVALLLSVQLSLFLARTIVKPLRALVRAAVRARLGRDREVVVPRLPERGDEIGLLARAFSDTVSALRQRIDAGESFAADVSHELKNPLASLRSALESLAKVDDPDLREKLHAIAAHDVQRIDRLISEIADASRIDAELSRARFEPVDLPALAQRLVAERDGRLASGGTRVTMSGAAAPASIRGDSARLERVIDNLIDNALSFSPPDGVVQVGIARLGGKVILTVADDGPGVPPGEREAVFERFHSVRPPSEAFGGHSGLGLAIARTIVEAHEGDAANRR
ncbi:stimulus-sensing domain-containing protein [Novosphingobium sp. Gsoil 351]|uniref:stimulus-sensing domain-containing protein n=1 Tax=Novosphingobium sp. Gsoil 351 TaxID=2675225 RepID=UPI001E57F38A|nr:stimulus-sensing domain-containing protein [Novosphingobium sp. Gsoil 351]